MLGSLTSRSMADTRSDTLRRGRGRFAAGEFTLTPNSEYRVAIDARRRTHGGELENRPAINGSAVDRMTVHGFGGGRC